MRRKVAVSMALLGAAVLAGCGALPGSGNGGILPSSVAIAIDEVTSAGSDAAQVAPLDSPGLYYYPVTFGGDQTNRVLAATDELLGQLSVIEDALAGSTGSTITYDRQDDFDPNDADDDSAQGAPPNPFLGYLKIDLRPFDFYGDGEVIGSGNATELPIALRVWIRRDTGSYERMVCGVITALPTEDSNGAGVLMVMDPAPDDELDGAQRFVQWSQADPSDKMVLILDRRVEQIGGEDTMGYAYFLVTQRDVGSHVEKTIKTTHNVKNSEVGFDTYNYLARWYTDADALVFSDDMDAADGSEVLPRDEVCASLITFEAADASAALGVSTSDFQFPGLPMAEDLSWPEAFGATPGF
ncbi:MAG TPA: hypothetical protein VMZ31_02275 [Phycisphaerae bacterium]|nr:hypothetical protein [Phycisphaerae bacterium]